MWARRGFCKTCFEANICVNRLKPNTVPCFSGVRLPEPFAWDAVLIFRLLQDKQHRSGLCLVFKCCTSLSVLCSVGKHIKAAPDTTSKSSSSSIWAVLGIYQSFAAATCILSLIMESTVDRQIFQTLRGAYMAKSARRACCCSVSRVSLRR